MKLSIIFMFSFFLVSLVGGIVLISSSTILYNDNLVEGVNTHLEGNAKLKAQHIETFLEMTELRIVDFSSDGKIKACLYDINNNIIEGCGKDELTEHLIKNKLPVIEGMIEVFTIDINGEVVASTNKDNIGLKRGNNPYFLYAKEELFFKDLYFSETLGEKLFTVSAPVIKDGKFIGVVVGRIKPENLFDITTSKIGLKETEEFYIVNSNSFLITPSKFLRGENKGILTQKVDTENTRNCFSTGKAGIHFDHEEITFFLDYRGVDVLGAHEYIIEPDWCLLVEVDKSEVINIPLKEFIIKQVIVSLIIIFILTLIGFFVGRGFDRRYKLRRGKR